ncbi:MAG: glycine oxidase ThiO [Gemmatimonadota bacterium]
MKAARSPDVVVVGGGVIGCAVARAVSLRGMRVQVVERAIPGREATWAAAGMLAPRSEATEAGASLDLGLRSLASYPELAAALLEESGVDVGLTLDGKLDVALSEREAAALRGRARSVAGLEWVEPSTLRRLEPRLSREVVGGAWAEDEGSVDSRRLARALWLAAARAGARFRLGIDATSVNPESKGALRVELADGITLRAAFVVVAAGAWSGRLGGLPRALPVRPVRGQMAAVRATEGPRHVVFGSAGYALARGGLVLAGATEEDAGYRDETTAAGIAAVLGGLVRLFPDLGGAAVVETWSGLRPGSPDGAPLLGPDPDVPGLWYATGHYRSGILLAPETGRVCADGIAAGVPAPVAFSPARFGARQHPLEAVAPPVSGGPTR